MATKTHCDICDAVINVLRQTGDTVPGRHSVRLGSMEIEVSIDLSLGGSMPDICRPCFRRVLGLIGTNPIGSAE